MRNEPTNRDDVIDSRDIIERIDELETSIDSAYDEYCEARKEIEEEPLDKEAWLELEHNADGSIIAEEHAELQALESLQDEASGYAGDWRHGATLVRDSYWVEYVQDMLADIGDLPRDLPGYIAIDWDKTADNIKVDYTSVDFDGVTYWVR